MLTDDERILEVGFDNGNLECWDDVNTGKDARN
jgi:hypothetical protein